MEFLRCNSRINGTQVRWAFVVSAVSRQVMCAVDAGCQSELMFEVAPQFARACELPRYMLVGVIFL